MVSSPVLIGIAASAALSILWPTSIFFICRSRMTLLIRNVLVGAGAFFVFSQVLERSLHVYLLKLNPTTAAWFQAHPIGFALYGCLAAGLFEEVGRVVGMRTLVRVSGTPGTAVAYGIGHGGLEAILIGGLAMVQTFTFAILLNSGRFDATFGSTVSPEAIARMQTSLEQLTLAGLTMGTVERLIALLIQIGLSLVVWRAVEKGWLGLLALAVLCHAVIDFPVALAQTGQLSSSIVEGLLLTPIVHRIHDLVLKGQLDEARRQLPEERPYPEQSHLRSTW